MSTITLTHIGGPTILIEVDGWRYHASRSAFEADRRRDAMLQGAGWVVLRFTWLQIVQRPDWVAQRIAATLGVRSSQCFRDGDGQGS